MCLRKLSEDLKAHIIENDRLCNDKSRLEAEVRGSSSSSSSSSSSDIDATITCAAGDEDAAGPRAAQAERRGVYIP